MSLAVMMRTSAVPFTLQLLLASVSLATAAKVPRHMRAPRTELSHQCSRGLSRTVRHRFQRHVARARKDGIQLNASSWPDACPFSPWVDIFGWQEKNKSRSKSEWVCNYTGKTFKSEHYIDLHMETHYMKEAPQNGVCLADYCEVFGFCNVVEPTFFESLAAEPPPCDSELLETQKSTCQSVIDRCALPDDPAMPHLNADLHRSLCEPLTCEFIARTHHTNRKVCLVGGGSAALFLVFMIVCCAFAPSAESEKRSYGKDHMYSKTSKGRPSGRTKDRDASAEEIIDIIPTLGKPIKQE